MAASTAKKVFKQRRRQVPTGCTQSLAMVIIFNFQLRKWLVSARNNSVTVDKMFQDCGPEVRALLRLSKPLFVKREKEIVSSYDSLGVPVVEKPNCTSRTHKKGKKEIMFRKREREWNREREEALNIRAHTRHQTPHNKRNTQDIKKLPYLGITVIISLISAKRFEKRIFSKANNFGMLRIVENRNKQCVKTTQDREIRICSDNL